MRASPPPIPTTDKQALDRRAEWAGFDVRSGQHGDADQVVTMNLDRGVGAATQQHDDDTVTGGGLGDAVLPPLEHLLDIEGRHEGADHLV